MKVRDDNVLFTRLWEILKKHGFDPYQSKGEFLAAIERLIVEAQAVTVERCALQCRSLTGDDYLNREFVRAIRALSPDPNFLDRKMAEERLRTLRDWPELCNGDTDVPLRHAKLCKYHREIARLERELAPMRKEKP